jgi:hypothetical protein
MSLQAQRLDALDDMLNLVFRRTGLKDDNHGSTLG